MKKKTKILLKTAISVQAVIAATVAFVKCSPSFGANPSKEARSKFKNRTEYFYNGRFHNMEDFKFISAGSLRRDKKKNVAKRPSSPIPVKKIDSLPAASEGELKLTWFGHSSTLLQMKGMNILIDPVFSRYASPVSFAGPKRMAEVPMKPADLPHIDVVLISHDHYDHLDYRTIKEIDDKVDRYCIPLGMGVHLLRWGINKEKINEMAWWEELDINGLKIVSTPCKHYSLRIPWSMYKTWWCGFLLKDGRHSVCYTGDTGYSDAFKEINKRYGKMDLVLAENGQYDDSWAHSHMRPFETLKAVEEMQAEWVIPVHWAGFVLAYHSWNEPPEKLIELAAGSEISIAVPMIGETVDYKELNRYQDKWWKFD